MTLMSCGCVAHWSGGNVVELFSKDLTMVNFKKMDDKDFVFGNNILTNKQDTGFSEFLKLRKLKLKKRKTTEILSTQ